MKEVNRRHSLRTTIHSLHCLVTSILYYLYSPIQATNLIAQVVGRRRGPVGVINIDIYGHKGRPGPWRCGRNEDLCDKELYLSTFSNGFTNAEIGFVLCLDTM